MRLFFIKNLWFILITMCAAKVSLAQEKQVYKITADSVKITGCDSAELILENHTQDLKGFLYNTGNGRTIFKKGVEKINDSMYVMGADTFRYNAWVQGGNTFGRPGILGTSDYNPLNLYTAGAQRASIGANGNMIIGTGTDNGSLLQVKGQGSFSGNVDIGTATITNGGLLYGTNAILFRHFIPRFHNYSHNSPFVGKLDDVLYNYTNRLNTTSSFEPDGTLDIDIVFPNDEIGGGTGIVYPQGTMYFSFWDNGIPQDVSVTSKNSSGTWYGPNNSGTNISGGGSGLIAVNMPGVNWLTEIKVKITPQPGGFVNLQNMEYVLDVDEEGLSNPHPYVSKYGDERFYNFFFLKSSGVDNVRISPYLSYANYFMNNVLIGSTTDNGYGKLQVTGNITSTGSLGIGTTSPAAQLHATGDVRFSGLTNDDNQTRVVVTDANGTLFYRTAASLAVLDASRSSLAVNGPIRARSLRLDARDAAWPDYVFDSSYHLMDIGEVDKYIREHHHLPGIAGAMEIADSGLNVGESQAVLLKKIEELTLYSIRQQQQLAAQAAMLEKQSRQLEQFQKEMQLWRATDGNREKKNSGK